MEFTHCSVLILIFYWHDHESSSVFKSRPLFKGLLKRIGSYRWALKSDHHGFVHWANLELLSPFSLFQIVSTKASFTRHWSQDVSQGCYVQAFNDRKAGLWLHIIKDMLHRELLIFPSSWRPGPIQFQQLQVIVYLNSHWNEDWGCC